ncbi:MAG: hypothetical protein HRT45_08785, partial [Bdellovibrionales bacterium]|nr:hypothetical protein [Bdellovibrionales bacterium]
MRLQVGISCLCLALLSLIGGHHSLAQSRLSEAEITALEEYGSQFQGGMGVVLTPPIGNTEPDVEAAAAYLKELVELLAGDKLREKNAEVVVNLYSTNNVNAFAHQIDTEQGIEHGWVTQSKTPWPIRTMYKIEDGKTIIEFGFTVGLLAKLKTRAQLGFIVGHEIAHFLEGHTHHHNATLETKIQKMWTSQSDEGVADNLAIKYMVGKLDLQGAIFALLSLAADNTELSYKLTSVADAVEAGASTHHDTGVRISMAQVYIEALLRTDPLARNSTDESLPNYFSRLAQRNPRDGVPFDNAADVWHNFERVVHQTWMRDKRYLPVTRPDWHHRPSDILREVLDHPAVKLNLNEFFNAALDEIEKAEGNAERSTKALRVNAFLQLL